MKRTQIAEFLTLSYCRIFAHIYHMHSVVNIILHTSLKSQMTHSIKNTYMVRVNNVLARMRPQKYVHIPYVCRYCKCIKNMHTSLHSEFGFM